MTALRTRYSQCDPDSEPLPAGVAVVHATCANRLQIPSDCSRIRKTVKEVASVSSIKRKLIEDDIALTSLQKPKTVTALVWRLGAS